VSVLRREILLIGQRPYALAHDNYFEKVFFGTTRSVIAVRPYDRLGADPWLHGASPTIDPISRGMKMDLSYK
jgi:hypothetical protein